MTEMITTRKHKVAIASEDGKRIAGHFRAAPLFIVYTVRNGRLYASEARVNSLALMPADDECSADCWKVMDEILKDVRVVICSGMGENAYVGLLKRDILPLLTEEVHAEKAMDAYLHGRLKEQPELVRCLDYEEHENRCPADEPPLRG